jgi:Ca2+-transporting ATPase
MVFTTLTLGQMAHALSIRSTRESLLTIGLFSNKALLGAVALTLVLQLAVIYLPFLQRIFNTQALSPGILVLNLALSAVILVAVEFAKWLQRRNGASSGGKNL